VDSLITAMCNMEVSARVVLGSDRELHNCRAHDLTTRYCRVRAQHLTLRGEVARYPGLIVYQLRGSRRVHSGPNASAERNLESRRALQQYS